MGIYHSPNLFRLTETQRSFAFLQLKQSVMFFAEDGKIQKPRFEMQSGVTGYEFATHIAALLISLFPR